MILLKKSILFLIVLLLTTTFALAEITDMGFLARELGMEVGSRTAVRNIIGEAMRFKETYDSNKIVNPNLPEDYNKLEEEIIIEKKEFCCLTRDSLLRTSTKEECVQSTKGRVLDKLEYCESVCCKYDGKTTQIPFYLCLEREQGTTVPDKECSGLQKTVVPLVPKQMISGAFISELEIFKQKLKESSITGNAVKLLPITNVIEDDKTTQLKMQIPFVIDIS